MAIDLFPNAPNSSVKGFNTADIMLYFIRLNPQSKKLPSKAQDKLALIESALAEVSESLHISLAQDIEQIRTYLASKGPASTDILKELALFESNYLPSLYIPQNDLLNTFDSLKAQYMILIKKGNPDLEQIEKLKQSIATFSTSKVQPFVVQKNNLAKELARIEEKAVKTGFSKDAATPPETKPIPQTSSQSK